MSSRLLPADHMGASGMGARAGGGAPSPAPAHPRRHALTATLASGLALLLCCLILPAVASAAPTTGAIEGKVTEAAAPGNPLKGIEVCAILETNEAIYLCGYTAAGGEYALADLEPGSYYLLFYAGESFNYVTQYYEDKGPLEEPEAVLVKAGDTTSGIDAKLEEGGSVSGAITNAGGEPVAEVEACAYQEVRHGSEVEALGVECAVDEENGKYTISKLPAGTYEIAFFPYEGNYITPEFYKGALLFEKATPVPVTVGKTAESTDIELQAGGSIAGTVTSDSVEKEPIEGLPVCAIEMQGSGESEECELTNQRGEYTIPRLASGSYVVEFLGESCSSELSCSEPYETQLYSGATSVAQATRVSVAAPETTGGIDASMLDKSPKQPANLQTPTLSGTATVGSTLTCSQGSWVDDPTSLTYAWLRNGSAIAGQTSSTYALVSEDEGATITCEVTASNAAGATVSTSNAVQVGKVSELPEKSKANSEPHKGVAAVSAVKLGHGGSVSVTLRCAGGNPCKGTVKVLAWTLGRVYGHGDKHQVKSFLHLVPLGSVKFTLAAGAHKTLKLRLTKKGRALLGAPGGHSLKLNIAGTGVKARKLPLK